MSTTDPQPQADLARLVDPARLASAFFADNEPVLQSFPLIEDIAVPVFGNSRLWPCHAYRKPANLAPSMWVVNVGIDDPVWNLRVREMVMAMFNPTHPAVQAAGVSLRPDPANPSTCLQLALKLHDLAKWAAETGLPSDLGQWETDSARWWVDKRRGVRSPATVASYVGVIKSLYDLGPVLSGGGLAADPWPGQSARKVAGYKPQDVKTENIAPEVWFPLIRAAWTYIRDFAPDILRARDRYQQLKDAARHTTTERLAEIAEKYLADERNPIPLHTELSLNGRPGEVHWTMLSLMMGFPTRLKAFQGNHHRAFTPQLRRSIEEAARTGRALPGGLLAEYALVTLEDGTEQPWHPGLCPRRLSRELLILRGACYIFIAALSMMRDNEVREITRGSVVEHYGAPAVASRKRKLDPDQPVAHWWITEPVAEAIAVAEQISWHPVLIFSSASQAWDTGVPGRGEGFDSGDALKDFIAYVNRGTAHHGLHIPKGRVTPHMFRKTMSMLTAEQPGGEIALGIQLKHVAVRALANRTTDGYGAADTNWAKLLDKAIENAHFTRLSEFYDAHHAGQSIGFGPGAANLAATFDAIKDSATKLVANGVARQGDVNVEYDLLRKAGISLRFGKLNHCLFDERNPTGAKCIENAIVPEGHTGPLIDRCQPSRCANSLIAPEHLPPWQAEHGSLTKQLAVKKMAPCRRAALEQQLIEVEAVIARGRGQ
ncbi:integrase [Kitasatospora cineracea]|uniref:integrase n=1 Tax=Kitasatospora cineracea TaxID=88074 RepID=UPI0037FA9D4E